MVPREALEILDIPQVVVERCALVLPAHGAPIQEERRVLPPPLNSSQEKVRKRIYLGIFSPRKLNPGLCELSPLVTPFLSTRRRFFLSYTAHEKDNLERREESIRSGAQYTRNSGPMSRKYCRK